MKNSRVWLLALFALLAVSAFGQDWQTSYDQGIASAKAGEWEAARLSFLNAATVRADQSTPTTLPDSTTLWHGGAPYSPSFMAAYAEYRLALAETDQAKQTERLQQAAKEFESLLSKGQRSGEAYYYLSAVYVRLGDQGKKDSLQKQVTSWGPVTWRVDTSALPQEDVSTIQAAIPTGRPQSTTAAAGPAATNTQKPANNNGKAQPNRTVNIPLTPAGSIGEPPGVVVSLSTKFALIVGNNSEGIAFAGNDALRIKDALITHAGYPESNIVVLQDAGADQIKSAAAELAGRMPDEGTVLIYYTGAAEMKDAKDVVGGLAKTDLYAPFVQKAARIFAFFQVSRARNGDGYFGTELSPVGSIAQMNATLPGRNVERTVRDGKDTGVFTEAFIQTLAELRTNRVPIYEFGWQLFYKIRRGATGTTGGGSSQTPTLPVLANMAADARF